jgi:hypothetical protein
MSLHYRRPLSGALRALMLIPALLLLLLTLLIISGQGNGNPIAGGVIMGALALIPLGFAAGSRAFAQVDGDTVTVGFQPFWRTRFQVDQLAEVDIVLIDAWQDYHGWGVKGAPRSPRGLLYSAGGTAALRFTLTDGRRYLVGCDPDTPEAVRMRDELNAQLSAGQGT